MDQSDLFSDENNELSDENMSLIKALARLICECINRFEGYVCYHLEVARFGEYVVTIQAASPLSNSIEKEINDQLTEWLRSN